MKIYTEEQLLNAIEYACEYADNSDLKKNSILLLDALADNKTAFSEILLSDIFNIQ
jgi:hypothetical protein